MGIINGSCTLRKFYCSKKRVDPLTENLESQVRNLASQDFEVMTDEKALGWVAPTHMLDTNISLEKILFGGWLCVVMRSDKRSVPSNLLKAYVEIEIDATRRGGRTRISKAERAEITDKYREELMKKVLPRISGVDFCWNLQTGEILLGSLSNAANDTFVGLFRETFGFELYPADIREIASKYASEDTMFAFSDLIPTNFSTIEEKQLTPDGSVPIPLVDEFIGREFMTWLMYRCEAQGGEFKLADGISIGISFDDHLELSSGEEDSQRIILRKGTPTISAEAAIALKSGRQVEKAKIILGDPEEEWMMLLSSDGLSVSSMKLPRGEERHPAGRIRERCESASRALKYVESVFMIFVDIRVDEESWKAERLAIAKWIHGKL